MFNTKNLIFPDMTAAVNRGIEDGGNFAKLLIGSQVNRMRDIEDPTQRQAFANKNFFGRQLRAQLKEDEAAQAQALREQQKHDADIYNTLAQGGERIANAGKTTQETGANRYGLGRDVWMAVTQSGNLNAGKMLLNRHLASGAIGQPTYDALNSQLTALEGQEPSAVQAAAFNQAKSTLDPKYNFATVDAQEANATNLATNQNTVNATLKGQQVQKEIADANRVSNDKYRMQQLHMQQNKGQIVNAADGKSYIFYPSLNKYEPMLDQNGQHVAKTSDQKAINEENQRISRLNAVLDEVGGVADKDGVRSGGVLADSTNSYIGRGVDHIFRAFGAATEGDIAAAKLGTLGGQLVALMPKMSGPQSDKDVEMYKQMAGKLDDPTLPYEVRKSALDAIDSLNKKYANINNQQQGVGIPYKNAGQQQQPQGGNATQKAVSSASSKWGI